MLKGRAKSGGGIRMRKLQYLEGGQLLADSRVPLVDRAAALLGLLAASEENRLHFWAPERS